MRMSRNVASPVPEEYNSAVLGGVRLIAQKLPKTALPAERQTQGFRIPQLAL
jgi:hypothetical protein